MSDQGAKNENEAINRNRTVTARAKGRNTAILPGGIRVDATPFLHVRYEMQNDAQILGEPERMLSEDWKREHAGWKYSWPIRMSDATAAMIRSGYYVPVPHDAVDGSNPQAAIAEIVTPNGKYVVWKTHILVGSSPEAHYKLNTQYEDYAIARTASNADQVQDELSRRFGGGGYEAEVSPFIDQRQSKTGD